MVTFVFQDTVMTPFYRLVISVGLLLPVRRVHLETHGESVYEPAHEIVTRFVLRKLILQTRMRSYAGGLDVWCLVGPFVYFHTVCVRTAKALARLRGCAGSPEPSLVAYVISTIISWAVSFYKKAKRFLILAKTTVLGRSQWKTNLQGMPQSKIAALSWTNGGRGSKTLSSPSEAITVPDRAENRTNIKTYLPNHKIRESVN